MSEHEKTAPDDHTAVFRPSAAPAPVLLRRPDVIVTAPAPIVAVPETIVTPAKKVVRVRPASAPAVSAATKYQAAAPRRMRLRRLIASLVALAGLATVSTLGDRFFGPASHCAQVCAPFSWIMK